MNKKIVYACNTKGYDDNIIHTYHNPDYDYVLFTDDEKLLNRKKIGMWNVMPMKMTQFSDSLNNRWHKMHPHILFPDYDQSLFVDGNLDILTPKLFDIFEKSNKAMMFPKHPYLSCIFEEINRCKVMRLDSPKNLNNIEKFIRKQGMPEYFGMSENNLIFRKHHDAQVKKVNEKWWNMVSKHCGRDQCSLSYIFWKENINIKDLCFANERYMIEPLNYYIYPHKKKAETQSLGKRIVKKLLPKIKST